MATCSQFKAKGEPGWGADTGKGRLWDCGFWSNIWVLPSASQWLDLTLARHGGQWWAWFLQATAQLLQGVMRNSRSKRGKTREKQVWTQDPWVQKQTQVSPKTNYSETDFDRIGRWSGWRKTSRDPGTFLQIVVSSLWAGGSAENGWIEVVPKGRGWLGHRRNTLWFLLDEFLDGPLPIKYFIFDSILLTLLDIELFHDWHIAFLRRFQINCEIDSTWCVSSQPTSCAPVEEIFK